MHALLAFLVLQAPVDMFTEGTPRENALKAAKAYGLTPLFDRGLGMTLVDVREGRKTLKALKKAAIELVGDSSFRVLQVIDQNNVLFHDSSTDAIVWLKNYAKLGGEVTWIEGASLESMEWGYVTVRGTMKYQSVFGSRQAIIIEAAF